MFVFPRAGAAGIMMARRRPLVNFNGPDATFSRASVATWWDDLLLTRYATNVLRQSESINGIRAFALEGARTNSQAQSNNLATPPWSIGGVGTTVTTDALTAPDGTPLDAEQAEFVASGASRVVRDTEALTDNTLYAQSGFGREVGTAWTLSAPGLQMLRKDGSAAVSVELFATGGAWNRISQVVDVLSGGTTPQTRFRNNQTEARACGIWGAQIEEGAFATSLIETAGAAATRAGDDLLVTGGNSVFATPFQIWLRPGLSSAQLQASGADMYLLSRLPGEYLRLESTGSNIRARVRDNTGQLSTTGGTVVNDRDVLRIEWNPTGAVLTLVNETTATTAALGGNGALVMGAGNVQVGSRSDTSEPYFGLVTEPYPLR